MALETKKQRERSAAVWNGIRSEIQAELHRFASRYPASRRLPSLRALADAASREDCEAIATAGLDYLRITRIIPPGCYGVRSHRDSTAFFLSGERIRGRLKPEEWSICRHNPQVWR